ncbi:MAG: hypothetical protein EPO24_01565 [Bacteroidetes bacterium]|nr:MAG: hypothetical protein EPO24_01565 [Bacteroidota bacterium]
MYFFASSRRLKTTFSLLLLIPFPSLLCREGQNESPKSHKAKSAITTRLIRYCDNILQKIKNSDYGCALSVDEYYWGSNSVLAGYERTNQERYREAALVQLHYLLGRNTFGISFLTGSGSNPVRHPYHQFSMMLNENAPVPGLLVGGPNKNSQLEGKSLSSYPGKCYEDNEKNYYVNEVAINYTAPFAYVLGYFSAPPPSSTKSGSVGKR